MRRRRRLRFMSCLRIDCNIMLVIDDEERLLKCGGASRLVLGNGHDHSGFSEGVGTLLDYPDVIWH
jgi:hypothetical protein